MKRALFYFGSILFVIGSFDSALALDWTPTTLNLELEAGGAELSGSFGFKNASNSTVLINKVLPSCDCLVINPFPSKIEAGQHGSVAFTYRAPGREGVQAAKITVVSSDAVLPQTLNLIVKLSPAVNVGPGLLLWEKSRQTQSVQITNNVPELKLDPHIETSKEFSIKLVILRAGISYRLDISPPPTKNAEGWAIVTFKDSAGGAIQKKIRLIAN